MLFYSGFGILAFMTALWDFLFYRIPNLFVLVMLGLFMIMAIGGQVPFSLSSTFLVSGLFLGVSFIFYLLGWCGAGDAKFLVVSSLWVGPSYSLLFLLAVSLIGGALAVFYLLGAPYLDMIRHTLLTVLSRYISKVSFFQQYAARPFIYANAPTFKEIKIPYGIAVAGGDFVLIYLILTGHLTP